METERTQVVIHGNLFAQRETVDWLVAKIGEAVSARDMVFIKGSTISAGDVVPGPATYVVARLGRHATLRAGDIVRVAETPAPDLRNWLLRDDWTLHAITDSDGSYVRLRPRSPDSGVVA